jgi:hypothetical protein
LVGVVLDGLFKIVNDDSDMVVRGLDHAGLIDKRILATGPASTIST